MIILGLTGSIGMGKSTAAVLLRRLGVPVHDADKTVHRALALGGAAVAPVATAFGDDMVEDGAINRRRLGARVFSDPDALRRLEAILHPLVRRAERHFLVTAARRRVRLVVLDVPLLFETDGSARVDATIVVSAPLFVQRARVLARPGMTVSKFENILRNQMPDHQKRRRADFVIMTGRGKLPALRALSRVVKLASRLRGDHWPPHPRRPSTGAPHA